MKFYLLIFAFFSGTMALAHGVTPTKAAELALHRIERLVILKKLEPGFLTSVQSSTVTLLDHVEEEEPTFKIVVNQIPGPDGLSKSVEIILDEEGRPLSYTPSTTGSAPSNPPTWPDKDSVTLAENALHYLLDNPDKKPEVTVLNESFLQYFLAQTLDESGKPVAKISIYSKTGLTTGTVYINADGTYSNSEIVQPSFVWIKKAIFDSKCLNCHNPNGNGRDVPLDSLAAMLASPREIVLPGKPDESGLVLAIDRAQDDRRRMPPIKSGPPLLVGEIKLIRQWILAGATQE